MEDETAATTRSEFQLVAQVATEHAGHSLHPHKDLEYFRSADWSPDGTCLITNWAADHSIRTFIVPPDLLQPREETLSLQPYSSIQSRDAVDAVVCYPGYSLEDPSTTLILSAVNEHPIRLNSALTGDQVASYPLINPNTEAYIKPQSMIFTADGSHFIAGSQRLIAMFDVSRSGNEPLSLLKTGPRKNNSPWSNPNLALGGLISALAIDEKCNVLAAGTLSRKVALYDSTGQGECVGVFSVAESDADKAISGNGITQLAWSECGRYLYIVERKSDGAMIYDIRSSGRLLSWVTGRAATTNQRMKVQLGSHTIGSSYDLWAGGRDGDVRRWNNPHLREGPVFPTETFKVHQDLVNSISIHRTADVFVTAAGQHVVHDPGQQADPLQRPSSEHDSLLKIWHKADH